MPIRHTEQWFSYFLTAWEADISRLPWQRPADWLSLGIVSWPALSPAT